MELFIKNLDYFFKQTYKMGICDYLLLFLSFLKLFAKFTVF